MPLFSLWSQALHRICVVVSAAPVLMSQQPATIAAIDSRGIYQSIDVGYQVVRIVPFNRDGDVVAFIKVRNLDVLINLISFAVNRHQAVVPVDGVNFAG